MEGNLKSGSWSNDSQGICCVNGIDCGIDFKIKCPIGSRV